MRRPLPLGRSSRGFPIAPAIGCGLRHLFVFVTNRDLTATNKGSERALRPCAVYRKITNGFRSQWAPRSTPISDPSSKPHGEDRSESAPSTPSASPSKAAPSLAQLENVNAGLSNYPALVETHFLVATPFDMCRSPSTLRIIAAKESSEKVGAKQRLHFIETPTQSIAYKSQVFNPSRKQRFSAPISVGTPRRFTRTSRKLSARRDCAENSTQFRQTRFACGVCGAAIAEQAFRA